jgi:hypothetical protein
MIAPLASHFDNFSGRGIDDVPDNGYRLSYSIDLYFGNRIAGILAGEGYPFDLTLQIGEVICFHHLEK